MPTTAFDAMHCSIARTADLVGDAWSLLILRDLFLGLTTFDELHRDLGIATNVLAARLDRLVTEGVLERRRYLERPPRHDYHLTAAGRDLFGVVLAMLAWGDRHRAAEGPPLVLTHDTCGSACTPSVTCAACGGALEASAVTAAPGPGGRAARGTALIGERLATRR